MKALTGNTYQHREFIKSKGGRWNPTAKSWSVPDEVYAEVSARVSGTIYNSLPPADLTGDESPESLASKFGRTAVPGAKVKKFAQYGLAKGDNGSANGHVEVRRAKDGSVTRYLQVARSSRRYLSRDDLEDFDMFGCEPGGSYSWDGVEVVPTPEESSSDTELAQARDASRVAKESAIAAAAADKQRRLDEWNSAISGLVRCSCHPEWTATGRTIVLGSERDGSRCSEFVLPDGRKCWSHSITSYDDWRENYYVPDDVARAECLKYADEMKISLSEAVQWLEKYNGCEGADIYRFVVERGQ